SPAAIAISTASIFRPISTPRSGPRTAGCSVAGGLADRFSTPRAAERSRPIGRSRRAPARSGVWKPFLFLLVIELLGCAHPPKPAPQDPSPMVDFTRAHERLQKGTIEGLQFTAGGTEGR